MNSEQTAVKRVSFWRRLFGLVCQHDWALAEGISKGIITGNPRPLCLRRACTKCGRREEIEHFRYIYRCEGVDYMADPEWRESETNLK